MAIGPSNLFLQGELDAVNAQIASSEANIRAVLPSSLGQHDALKTVDFSHTDIHDGKVWRAGAFGIPGAGSTFSVLMVTPAAAVDTIHMKVMVETNGPGIVRLYEDPNASGGTAITPRNALRSFASAADSVLTYDPTMTASVGTQIGISVIGSEGFKSSLGGDAVSELWIPKPETNYVVQFTADGASTRTVIKIIWDED